MDTLNRLLDNLKELENSIAKGTWKPKKGKLFCGADICVRQKMPEQVSNGFYRDKYTFVISKHARQISALIFELKEICHEDLDYYNKYYFYGELANAANKAIEEDAPLRMILIRMIETVRICFYCDVRGLYFAYGSNIDELRFLSRCPDAFSIGIGTLPGFSFELDKAGVATVVPNEDSDVYGLLWRISKSDEANLDIYEGVSSGCYRKDRLPIRTDWGDAEALVYVSLRDANEGQRRNGYLDLIINAIDGLVVPAAYKAKLKSF